MDEAFTEYENEMRKEVLRPKMWTSRSDRDRLMLAFSGGLITLKEAAAIIDLQLDVQMGSGIDFALRATTEAAKAESAKVMDRFSKLQENYLKSQRPQTTLDE